MEKITPKQSEILEYIKNNILKRVFTGCSGYL